MLVLVCCMALVTAGCATARPPAHAAAVAAGPSRPVAAGRYLAIAEDGNRRLEVDFGRLTGRDRDRLAAAQADLRDAAATETPVRPAAAGDHVPSGDRADRAAAVPGQPVPGEPDHLGGCVGVAAAASLL